MLALCHSVLANAHVPIDMRMHSSTSASAREHAPSMFPVCDVIFGGTIPEATRSKPDHPAPLQPRKLSHQPRDSEEKSSTKIALD